MSQSCIYIKMNACFELNLQVVLCPHILCFHGSSSEARRCLSTSTPSPRRRNLLVENLRQSLRLLKNPLMSRSSFRLLPVALAFAGIHIFYWVNDTFVLRCLKTNSNSSNALVWNNHIVNMNHFRWKTKADFFFNSFLFLLITFSEPTCSNHTNRRGGWINNTGVTDAFVGCESGHRAFRSVHLIRCCTQTRSLGMSPEHTALVIYTLRSQSPVSTWAGVVVNV